VLTTFAEFEALASDWARLVGRPSEPMQSHAWLLAALRHLHTGARLRAIVIQDANELVAAAPLVETRRGGLTWLELPGAGTLHEPASLLARTPAALDALCRALVAQRMPLVLSRLDRDGPVGEMLARHARRRAWLAAAGGGSCLRVETADGWDSFERRLSGARRNALKRKRRLLERSGTVTFVRLAPAPGEVRAALRSAFEVEARSWKGTEGSAVLQRPECFEFFVELGERYAAHGQLEVRLLRLGESLAASQVGVMQDGRWWELKIGYDPKWSQASPGVLLTLQGLRDAFDRSLTAHEFLGSAADWQRPFATSERELTTLVLYPYRPEGLLALGRDGAGFAARRLRAVARQWAAGGEAAVRGLAQAVRGRIESAQAAWFDWRHGVETRVPVSVTALTDIDPSIASHAVHYEATTLGKFSRSMRILAPAYEKSTFVDLGAGKGRVLLLAALRPFRRVVGVEISSTLHAEALANAASFGRRNPRARPIECVLADASEYEFPEGDLVVFLYNPFDAQLMEKTCARLLAAVERTARNVGVVYVNPRHAEVFERTGRFERLRRDSSLAVYRVLDSAKAAA
jgi:CelD/BcsL family acetyltransferase involved in cellulose biosynthesis/16S rRNA G966 N2-methylase RsmD